MIVNNIVKKSIALAIRKGIRDTKNDLHRSLRNIVDLAMHLSTGRFKTRFLKSAQKMLSNTQSPYYMLVDNVVNQVSAQNLEIFGLNIGYMSWTYGAKFIREYEKENGYNVPWILLLDLEYETDSTIDIGDIVEQGKALGIYTYNVFLNGNYENCELIIDAIKRHQDCAFILMIGTDAVYQKLKILEFSAENILYIVDYNIDDFSEKIAELRSEKRMTGVCYNYNDKNAEDILTGRIVNELTSDDFTILFLIESAECSGETQKKVQEYVDDCRTEQKYPMFICDFFSDITLVDHIISDETCMMGIRADGAIITAENVFEDVNINDVTLEKAARILMPKVKRSRISEI